MPLTIDAEQVNTFFRLLHGNGENETEIRCIHPDRNLPVKSFWGSLEEPQFAEPFVQLNNEGYGIYLVVNRPDPSLGRTRVLEDGKAIADAHIQAVTALFVEMDDEQEEGENLERLQSAALPPSLIVRSSVESKNHGYWLLADCPLESFTGLQAQLIAQFGSDPSCKNLSRVMRVPGFWHTKAQPIQSRLLEAQGHIYTLAEICEAFGLDPELRLSDRAAAELPEDWQPPNDIQDRILKAAAKHTARIVPSTSGRHKTLLWFAMACKENRLEQSVAENLVTRVLPGLPAREGGEAVPLEEAIDVIEWVYAKASAGQPWANKKPRGNLVKVAAGRSASPEEEDDPFLEPPANVDVTRRKNGYAVEKERRIGKETETYYEQLTNWTFTPSLILNYPGGVRGERGILNINGARNHEIDLPAKSWNGRRDILEVVGTYGGSCFTNSSSDIAKIRQFIDLNYQAMPSATGVKSYGLHQHQSEWLELFEDKSVGNFETPPLFYAGTPVDPGSVAHASPPQAKPNKLEQVREAIPKLQGLGTRASSLAITGYAVASAFAPRITPYLGRKLPFCYVTGERETGKTTLLEINLELVNGRRNGRLQKAGGMTPYQYDLGFSNANNLLAVLDEYRPGAIDDAQFRKHHDLGTKWRGSGVAAKDHAYALNAPLIVAGEGFTDDAAALSRGVLYFLEKKDRGNLEFFNEMDAVPWYVYASHLHDLARTLPEEEHVRRIERARAIAKEAAKGVNPRLIYALTFIAYGLYVLQDDVSAEAYTEKNIYAVLAWGREHTLEGGNEGSTNLEMFLEQLGSVASEVKDPSSVVRPSNIVDELIIKISPSVELVKRRYGDKAAIANPRLLRRYASQVDYISNESTHQDVAAKTIRGIRISLNHVPSRCEISGLQYLEDLLRKDKS